MSAKKRLGFSARKRIKIHPKPTPLHTRAACCLGLVGGIFEIYEHHHCAKESHNLLLNVDKELKDTDSLLGKTDAVLEKITTVEIETSRIPTLTAKIQVIGAKNSVAREKHDPSVISNLQKELSAAEKAKLELSKQSCSAPAQHHRTAKYISQLELAAWQHEGHERIAED